jgi:hypothetical protein
LTTRGLACELKEVLMMSALSRGSAGFAAKMVGIGLGAGLLLVVCEFLLDTWFRLIR